MVILSRIVKPKMLEPQKYRRKGSQSSVIHAKQFVENIQFNLPWKPRQKKSTKWISKSFSSRTFGMLGLENF